MKVQPCERAAPFIIVRLTVAIIWMILLTAMFPDDNRDNILSTIENVVPVVSVVIK